MRLSQFWIRCKPMCGPTVPKEQIAANCALVVRALLPLRRSLAHHFLFLMSKMCVNGRANLRAPILLTTKAGLFITPRRLFLALPRHVGWLKKDWELMSHPVASWLS